MKTAPSIEQMKKNKTPSERIFYLNQIFEADSDGNRTNRARLYQNILEFTTITERKLGEETVETLAVDDKKVNDTHYSIRLQKHPDSFTIRQLENWLINYNIEFRNSYAGKHTTLNNKIANHDQRIKSYIHDLESSLLLAQVGKIECSKKNNTYTPEYSLTTDGIVILYLLKYKEAQRSDRVRMQQIIIGILKLYLSHYNSHICDFLSLAYSKIMQKGYGGSMIELLFKIVSSDVHKVHTLTDAFNRVLYVHRTDQRTRESFADIWIEVIRGLEENVKKVIMHHHKADIESQIHLRQPPKNWEEMLIKHVEDYNNFVLYGKCDNCGQKYPVLVDFYDFQKNSTQITDCDKCNTKGTLKVDVAVS